ncbi:MAG: small basic protein [Candidatus Omnitrophota bacterium]|nr:MAG: small basic protein [Candidatus Omnitrophota bacterium]
MSQHRSLKTSTLSRHRNVLKRIERIKILKEQGKWKEGDSFFALPKIKSLKVKVKKEKGAKSEQGAEDNSSQKKT